MACFMLRLFHKSRLYNKLERVCVCVCVCVCEREREFIWFMRAQMCIMNVDMVYEDTCSRKPNGLKSF